MVTSPLIPQDAAQRQSPFAAQALDAAAFTAALAEKRTRIDTFDQQIIALLKERTKVVEEVAELKQHQRLSVFMKPGREASIIRSMLAASGGQMPPRLIVQLWREVMMASLQLEQSFAVAAVVPAPGAMRCWELARDHFGCVTPLRSAPDADAALAMVRRGEALLAVLPDPVTDWLPLLLADIDTPQPFRLVFRLPFLGGALGDTNAAQGAWAVGPVPTEISGDDWTFLFLNAQSKNSHVQHEVGLPVVAQWPGAAGVLVALRGAVMPDDPRLAQWPGVWHIGVVAVPVAEE
jgi:chorismate mutase/prephenate dehydratase